MNLGDLMVMFSITVHLLGMGLAEMDLEDRVCQKSGKVMVTLVAARFTRRFEA